MNSDVDPLDFLELQNSEPGEMMDSDNDNINPVKDRKLKDEYIKNITHMHFTVNKDGAAPIDFKNSTTVQHKRTSELCPEYKSLGGPDEECSLCHARMWNAEHVNKNNVNSAPVFSLCCSKGRIKLPPVRPTPQFLLNFHNDRKKGPSFKKSIRLYNFMLSFTSIGGNIDYSINKGMTPYVFRLNGVNHHRFGSLMPDTGQSPKFCQLYIYDTENEVGNRIRSMNVYDANVVDLEVLEGLLHMLDENNELVKCFRMARDRFRDEDIVDLKIVMKVSRSESGRENHMAPSNEVAAIMVGDNDFTCGKHDIVIETKSKGLKRIVICIL